MKPKLLVIELWGVGDLAIATPFLRAAAERYEVTLVAKPYALDLQKRFWPSLNVVPFVAPWTSFKGKYRLWVWPWREILRLLRRLRAEQFDLSLSARWDPRDHLLLDWTGAKKRIGFPRMGSQYFLNDPLVRPEPAAHRYENWRTLARVLNLNLPPRDQLSTRPARTTRTVLVHSGAGQKPVRVWPLERYSGLIRHLRARKFAVQVACDADQQEWWVSTGESDLAVPHTIDDLLSLIDRAGAFIGNDSGPGHLAALDGVPTFTLFGPQLPEWFAPLHPAAEWIEGKPCPYKPCFDYCRFRFPHCLWNVTDEEVRVRVDKFLKMNLPT